ncbi:MAG: homoserine kinase [Truepera sp.]|nr:homoserine kinase [Truepera sp.]
MMRVRVPATSANLGPGFDCLGLAVNLQLEVEVKPAERDLLHYHGQGCVPNSADNLIHQGFHAAFSELGLIPPRVAFTAYNPIPLARGLGSSSAALVAGAALADAWLKGALGRDGVFQLTAQLEGHPDNVSPAVYGQFTVSARAPDGRFVTASHPLPANWRLLFAVPGFELPTSQARAVLPERYPRSDLILAASRSALWVAAVTLNRPELLRAAAHDVVHEPYREHLVPGMAACRQALYAAGATAVFLSGAGPALVAIVLSEAVLAGCCKAMSDFVGDSGRVLELAPSDGYQVVTPTV